MNNLPQKLHLLILTATAPLAATTWTGTSSQFWNTGGNWDAGVPDPAEAASFNGATPNNAIEIDGVASAASLTFGGPASYSLTPTTSSNTLTLQNSSIDLGGSETHTINASLITSTTLDIFGNNINNKVVFGGDNSGVPGINLDIGTISISTANNLCNQNGTVAFTSGSSAIHATSSLTIPSTLILSIADSTAELIVDSGQTLTVNSGIIQPTSNGFLIKSGSGTLVLNGANAFTDGLNINDGTVQVGQDTNLGDSAAIISIGGNGGAGTLKIGNSFTTSRMFLFDGTGSVIEVDSGNTLTHNGSIFDAGGPIPVTKSGGGTLILNGTLSYGGTTTITAGTLALNTAINGDIQVATGGRLGGNGGTLENLTNDGTVAPGNSIGTLSLLGDYVQGATGNFELEINTAGASDILDVTGSATLAGSLTVLPEPGLYTIGTTYDFLLTQGGVTGSFDSLIESSPLIFGINYLPVGNPLFAQLEITGISAIVPIPTEDLTGNARAVARYVFCPEEINTSDPDFVEALSIILSQTPTNYKKALVNLSSAQFGAIPLLNLNKDIAFSSSLVDRIEEEMWCNRCQKEERHTSLWMTPLGQWEHQEGIQGQYAFHTQTYGFNLGASHLFAGNFFLSGGLGYSYSDLHWKNHKGSSTTNALYIAPSIGYSQKRYFINLLAQFATNWTSVDRRIQFPGLTRIAQSHFTTYDLLTRLDLGYTFSLSDSRDPMGPFLFIPEGRLSYLNSWQGSFSENGAGSLNLNVKKKTTTFLQPEILLKILKEFYVGKGCVIPMVKTGYVAKIPLSSATYHATIDPIDCPSDLSVESFDWTSSQLMLGTGLLYKTQDHLTAGFDYEAHLFDKSLVQTAKITFDWAF
ncbi:MAG: autotransporter domain-containing protein [Chlamydiales bacterium]|nr:autotransporter domain-containing protein [Chlamydiales bacterium]